MLFQKKVQTTAINSVSTKKDAAKTKNLTQTKINNTTNNPNKGNKQVNSNNNNNTNTKNKGAKEDKKI